MKSVVIWVFRHLVIPAGFIWSAGIFSFIGYMSNQKEIKDPYNTFDSSEFKDLEMTPRTLGTYCDSLIEARKQKIKSTGIYLPDDFFHDLRQFKIFNYVYHDSLDKTFEGRIVLMSRLGPMSGGALGTLVNLRDENWRTKDFASMKGVMGIGEARSKWFPAEIDYEKRAQDSFNFVVDIGRPFTDWIILFYLRGLPFAFFMFLIWKFKLKKDYKEIFQKNPKSDSSPLSFLFSVLIWPIILFLDLRIRFNEVLRRTEILSRRDNLLSLFSKKENELFEIGRKMSKKDFKSYLDDLGLIRKHSFGKTFLFVVILGLSTNTNGFASGLSLEYLNKTECSVSVRNRIDSDIGFMVFEKPPDYPAVSENYSCDFKEKMIFNLVLTIGKILDGFIDDILCVPRLEILSAF